MKQIAIFALVVFAVTAIAKVHPVSPVISFVESRGFTVENWDQDGNDVTLESWRKSPQRGSKFTNHYANCESSALRPVYDKMTVHVNHMTRQIRVDYERIFAASRSSTISKPCTSRNVFEKKLSTNLWDVAPID